MKTNTEKRVSLRLKQNLWKEVYARAMERSRKEKRIVSISEVIKDILIEELV